MSLASMSRSSESVLSRVARRERTSPPEAKALRPSRAAAMAASASRAIDSSWARREKKPLATRTCRAFRRGPSRPRGPWPFPRRGRAPLRSRLGDRVRPGAPRGDLSPSRARQAHRDSRKKWAGDPAGRSGFRTTRRTGPCARRCAACRPPGRHHEAGYAYQSGGLG